MRTLALLFALCAGCPNPSIPVEEAVPPASSPSVQATDASSPASPSMFEAEGFRVADVPAGTIFRGIQDHEWDVLDAKGTRIAWIQEEPWNHASDPAVGPSEWKVAGLDAIREQKRVDWGDGPIEVHFWIFASDQFIFRIQQADGCGDWLINGFQTRP